MSFRWAQPLILFLVASGMLLVMAFHKPAPLHTQTKLKSVDSLVQTAQIVVLDYWFIGCAPCRKAIPSIDSLSLVYKNKPVRFYGLNSIDDEETMHTFHEKENLHYTTFAIAPELPSKERVFEYPCILIYKNGKREFTLEGFTTLMPSQLSAKIDEMLK